MSNKHALTSFPKNKTEWLVTKVMKKVILNPIYAHYFIYKPYTCKTSGATELIMGKAIEVFKERKITESEICERNHDNF